MCVWWWCAVNIKVILSMSANSQLCNYVNYMYQFLKGIIFQLILHPIHTLHIKTALKINVRFVRSLLQTYSLAKRIMTDKSLRSFLVFVRVAFQHFTGSDGVNQLRSIKYKILCVCVLAPCPSYPARKSRLFCAALHCHLWPAWLYHIFPHCLINATIFGNVSYFC